MGGDFPIHHVVNINFGAFTRAVKRLGLLLRRRRPRATSTTTRRRSRARRTTRRSTSSPATRGCAARTRSTSSASATSTRTSCAARASSTTCSEAKDQLGVERLFRDREQLLELFGRYTDTDIRSSAAVLRLLKLTYESSRSPLRRVRFRADLGQEFVTITDDEPAPRARRVPQRRGVARRVRAHARRARARRTRSSSRARSPRACPGSSTSGEAGEDQAVIAAPKIPFPVYYPKLIRRGGRFYDGFSSDAPRTYDLFDTERKRHRAYRMTIEAPGHRRVLRHPGHRLDGPADHRQPVRDAQAGGRELMLFRDGSRLRMVAWRTDNAVYWVSNTLLRSLTNRQMLGIARSLTRIGRGWIISGARHEQPSANPSASSAPATSASSPRPASPRSATRSGASTSTPTRSRA